MKRVLPFAALSFAAGILLQSVRSVEASIAVSAGFLIFLVYCILRKKHEIIVLCTVAAAFGFLYMGFHTESLEKKAALYEGRDVFVSGRVVGVYENKGSYFADVRTKGKNDGIKIRVYFYDEADVKYGDIIEFTAKFRRQSDLIKRASKLGGALLTCSVSGKEVKVCENKTSPLNPFDTAYKLRYYTEDRIDAYFSGDYAGILLGILTGNTLNVSDYVKNSFRICSLSHITAVSGMHVGIVLMLAMSVFGVLRIKKHKVSILFYIAIIWFFAIFAGLGASAVRASLMMTLFFAAYMLKRDNDAFVSLAAAASVMLIINPAVIYDMGFEFSVLSTAGVLVFHPLIYGKIKKYTGIFAAFISVTVSAQIATVPVVIYYFGYISLLGIFANIIVCPAIPLIMGLGIAFLAFSKIYAAAIMLAAVLKVILTALIFTVIFISNVPFAAVSIGFNIIWAGAYTVLCAAFYLLLIKKRRYALYLASLSMALFTVFAAVSCFGTGAELSFVSVGNGDCAVFKTHGAVIMFDGGGNKERDVGRETVLPYLRSEGISKVDVAFLTHPHFDHGQGFVPLLQAGVIKYIVLPRDADRSDLGRDIIKAAKLGGAKTVYLKGDASIEFCGITVDAVNTADGADENNGVVYYLTYGENRICITGDINKSAERKLAQSMGDMGCRLLKVSHHGSSTSSAGEFLKATGANFAVISCAGEKHPSDETVKAIRDEGMNFATTKINGDIKFIMNRKRFIKICLERGSVNEL